QVKHLLDKGADVNAEDNDHRTPLICATRNELPTDNLRLLLDKGANITKHGASALLVAADSDDQEKARLLLERGAGVGIKSGGGSNVLMLPAGGFAPMFCP